ncbi:MAG: hypothetical protein KIT31_08735 [Deltaproteobacteria bacterium]|nr:hypothetical protein [Deltaproteobacteria bacterium]
MSKRWLLGIAGAVVILNLLDAVFTIFYTGSGVATESNPFMQGVLEKHPVVFMITKLSLVSLCVTLLWRFKHRHTAVIGLMGTAAMYCILLGYHLSAVPLAVAQL